MPPSKHRPGVPLGLEQASPAWLHTCEPPNGATQIPFSQPKVPAGHARGAALPIGQYPPSVQLAGVTVPIPQNPPAGQTPEHVGCICAATSNELPYVPAGHAYGKKASSYSPALIVAIVSPFSIGFHVPQPILGCSEPLSKEGIMFGVGGNVRYPMFVSVNFDDSFWTRKSYFSVYYWYEIIQFI